ncbi:hypothetical protein [Roseateles sp. LKC17W]|uniref:Uncharacterized protein n=1 Tax=Pelomonas margarita TaxID=3299031 RepID=A0ABW7FJE6_9BURK
MNMMMSKFRGRLIRSGVLVALALAAQGAVLAQAVTSEPRLQAAAEAARRDTDPQLNGSPLAGDQASLPSLDDAWGDYERCHWREAFRTFAILADAGDPEAARMAVAMARYGALLYQQNFEVAAQRLDSWRRVSQVRASAAVASK